MSKHNPHILTSEQRAFRDKALLDNLHYKFKDRLEGYTGAEIVAAYDDWFLSENAVDEEGFLEFLPEK